MKRPKFPALTSKDDPLIIAIGASTGGPQAVHAVLEAIPAGISARIVISIHMPQGYTKMYADRISRITSITVEEASDGAPILPGIAYLCPGGWHMMIKKYGRTFSASIEPRRDNDIYIPSVTRMFESLIPVARNTLAIVLTGMGSDGADGLVALKNAGACVWAESEESAIVFGMPKEAISRGCVDYVACLDQIASNLGRFLKMTIPASVLTQDLQSLR